jgi:drug/metabolite transporter (DMT)-like permease
VIGGLLVVYVVWGSTYLAIRIAIETLPPFLMAGWRFLIAGGLLYGWTRWRGADRPSLAHWTWATLLGGLLLLGGNGLVTWAEQTVPSGLACLIITTVPLWMVLLEALRPGGLKPTPRIWLGLLCGFGGVLILVGQGSVAGSGLINPLGAVALVGAALSWSFGSIISRSAVHPPTPLLGTAMQMICGGVLLTIVGSLRNEWGDLHLSSVSVESVLALLYLAFFGSILAFSVYLWLLHATTPALVSTYAFVNPIVAVYSGWALADEALSARIVVAAGVIILGVILITGFGARSQKNRSEGSSDSADPTQIPKGSAKRRFNSSIESDRPGATARPQPAPQSLDSG